MIGPNHEHGNACRSIAVEWYGTCLDACVEVEDGDECETQCWQVYNQEVEHCPCGPYCPNGCPCDDQMTSSIGYVCPVTTTTPMPTTTVAPIRTGL